MSVCRFQVGVAVAVFKPASEIPYLFLAVPDRDPFSSLVSHLSLLLFNCVLFLILYGSELLLTRLF